MRLVKIGVRLYYNLLVRLAHDKRINAFKSFA